MESLPFRGGQRDLDRLGRALGPIAIQKVASRKWWFSVTRSAACFLHVRTGSSESRHLQTARAECRLVLERAARRWKTDKGRLHLRYRSNRSTRRRLALAAMTLCSAPAWRPL